VDGSVLLLMTDDAWAELGLASGKEEKQNNQQKKEIGCCF
jgi:hypothetical protein